MVGGVWLAMVGLTVVNIWTGKSTGTGYVGVELSNSNCSEILIAINQFNKKINIKIYHNLYLKINTNKFDASPNTWNSQFVI